MLNTFLSLKWLPGVDIEMIDIPVQITQQRNHSNAKYYHKRTQETPLSHNYSLNFLTKVKQSVNNHQLFVKQRLKCQVEDRLI